MSINKPFAVKSGLSVNTTSSTISVDINSTDAIHVPVGNSSNRPTGSNGMFRYNVQSGRFEGYVGGVWSSITDANTLGNMFIATYDPAGISEQLVGEIFGQTLTNKTLSFPIIDSPNLGVDSIDALNEIDSALLSGDDSTLVTGTAGAANTFAEWNIDGDLVSGSVIPAGSLVGTTDAQTLTNKTLTSPTINSPNFGAASFDNINEFASGIKSGNDSKLVTGTAGVNGDFAIWNSDGDLIDGPTPPAGSLVGTTDTQTLTNKTLTSPKINMGSDASGDIYYRNGSTFSRLPIGVNNKLLRVNAGLPAWGNAAGYGDFLQFSTINNRTPNSSGGIAISNTWNQVNVASGTHDYLSTIANGIQGDVITLTSANTESLISLQTTGNFKRLVKDHDEWLNRGNFMTAIKDEDSNWVPISRSGVAKADVTYQSNASILLGTPSTSRTFSSVPIGAAHTNRYVIVSINVCPMQGVAAIPTITSVTIGGISATVYQTTGSPAPTRALQSVGAIARALVPTGTTANIVINMSESCYSYSIATYRAVGLKSITPLEQFSFARISDGGNLNISHNSFKAVEGSVLIYSVSTTFDLSTSYDQQTLVFPSPKNLIQHRNTRSEYRHVASHAFFKNYYRDNVNYTVNSQGIGVDRFFSSGGAYGAYGILLR